MLIMAEVGTLVGIILPGVTAVLAFGYLGSTGAVHPVAACLVAIAGEIAGGHIAYVRGRRARRFRRVSPLAGTGARGADRSRAWSRLMELSQSMELRALSLVERHGAAAIVLCQWMAGVRTVTPRLVGSVGTSYRRFAVAQVPSAMAWVCTWMSVGAVAGAAYERVAAGVGVVGLLALALTFLSVVVWASVSHCFSARVNRASTPQSSCLCSQSNRRSPFGAPSPISRCPDCPAPRNIL
ncbi:MULTISPECIES: DedA family protein [unclassified Rhodococcus (in: high G+C Gram-positive bacteria)]|uniref:DedA family protein n=1 Tax=unclassified Rhodococcus (in: high G+C Gram-positive bacteria) TaxID=192944 RepID=UPI003FA6C304